MANTPDSKCAVLLVEDNKAHADLLSICLREIAPHQCISHAFDGEEAIDFLLCRGAYEGFPKPAIRLVLLDLRLPKADGIDILKAIRSEKSLMHLPVVIMSSSESPSDIRSAYANSASGYVVKPVDFEDFKNTVSSIASFWLDHNRLACTGT